LEETQNEVIEVCFSRKLQKIGKKKKKIPLLMFIDTVLCTIFLGSGLQDYLNYRFYEKSWNERRKYATIGYQAKINKKMASSQYTSFFSNKPNFLSNFQKYTKRQWYDPSQKYEKMNQFLDSHDVFVMKPIFGCGGADVEKVETKTITNRKEFYEKLKNEGLFIEELIIQDKKWGKISPNSINTLRIVTSAVAGNVKIIFAAARIGNGKSLTDNFHKGGMAVLIDLESGKLIGKAINKNLDTFIKHPVTKINFEGYRVPYFEEVKKMVLEAALVNEGVNLIGWDVAITNDGPVIIEGNKGPGWDIVQVLLNKGQKQVLKNIKKEMQQHNLW